MVKVFTQGTVGRENQLQFLRFLAFLNVFVLHIGTWRTGDYPAWNGAVSAVTFFFMLSGTLAGFSAYGKEIDVSWKSIGKDMWKRIRKVYPLVFLTTVFSAIHSGLPASIVHDIGNSGDSLIQLARNMLMIQAWFPEGALSFNGVSWYLSTLLFLYLFTVPVQAFLVRGGKKEKHDAVFTVLIFVLFLTTVGYSYITYNSVRFLDVHFWQYIFPPARLGQFLIGMLFGYMLRERKERGKAYNAGVFTLWELLALFFWVYMLKQPVESWYNRLVVWIIPNLFLLGIFLLGRGYLSKLFRLRPLVYLGDISFECYLLHECVIHFLGKVEPYTAWGRHLCSGIALGYTLLIAFYIHGKSRR